MKDAHYFEFNNNIYAVIVKNTNNLHSYLKVKDKRIYLFANLEMQNFARQEKFINAHKKFLENSLKKQVNNQYFSISESFIFINEIKYNLKFFEAKQAKLEFQGNNLGIYHTLKQDREKIIGKLLEKGIISFGESKIDYGSKIMKVPVKKIIIRNQKTKGGHWKHSQLELMLNIKLIFFEEKILDYLIIHELAHYFFQNHSKNFGKIVEQYFPNYKEAQKKLKYTTG